MNILDDPILGTLVDEIESDYSQEDVNQQSLYVHNQIELLDAIDKRKSKYELSYYVDNVSYLDLDYWVRLLKEVIRFYSINSLKIYLADEFQNNAQFDLAKFQKDVKSLILAIKIDLIDYIKDGKLVEMFDREAFYQFLIDNNIQSSLLIWAINYIDVESFEEFRDKLFNEAKQEYEE